MGKTCSVRLVLFCSVCWIGFDVGERTAIGPACTLEGPAGVLYSMVLCCLASDLFPNSSVCLWLGCRRSASARPQHCWSWTFKLRFFFQLVWKGRCCVVILARWLMLLCTDTHLGSSSLRCPKICPMYLDLVLKILYNPEHISYCVWIQLDFVQNGENKRGICCVSLIIPAGLCWLFLSLCLYKSLILTCKASSARTMCLHVYTHSRTHSRRASRLCACHKRRRALALAAERLGIPWIAGNFHPDLSTGERERSSASLSRRFDSGPSDWAAASPSRRVNMKVSWHTAGRQERGWMVDVCRRTLSIRYTSLLSSCWSTLTCALALFGPVPLFSPQCEPFIWLLAHLYQ